MKVVRYLLLFAFALSIGGLQGATLDIENRSRKVIFLKPVEVDDGASYLISGKPQSLNKNGEYKIPNKKTLTISVYGYNNMKFSVRGNNFVKKGKQITTAFKKGYITYLTIQKGGSYSTTWPKM